MPRLDRVVSHWCVASAPDRGAISPDQPRKGTDDPAIVLYTEQIATDMADSFIVKINLQKFRDNAATNGEEMTPQQVKEWLHDSGFRERADGSWLCEEISLALLAKEEIIEWRRF